MASVSAVIATLALTESRRAILPGQNGRGVIALESGEFSGEELAFGDKDDVEPGPRLVLTVDFSRPPLRAIAHDRTSQSPGRGHAEPAGREAGSKEEHGHETTTEFQTLLVDTLEIGAAPNTFVGAQGRPAARGLGHVRRQETVRRFRPFARRRFNTRRPFFVLMRSRKPWVLRRRLRFGWKVRFIG